MEVSTLQWSRRSQTRTDDETSDTHIPDAVRIQTLEGRVSLSLSPLDDVKHQSHDFTHRHKALQRLEESGLLWVTFLFTKKLEEAGNKLSLNELQIMFKCSQRHFQLFETVIQLGFRARELPQGCLRATGGNLSRSLRERRDAITPRRAGRETSRRVEAEAKSQPSFQKSNLKFICVKSVDALGCCPVVQTSKCTFITPPLPVARIDSAPAAPREPRAAGVTEPQRQNVSATKYFKRRRATINNPDVWSQSSASIRLVLGPGLEPTNLHHITSDAEKEQK
ncbi:unnamed protein product [Pleuronectes platessa]|uniref:Uncharacterized protein n=1 Tax=Pleuronectes platessa TaxID=8262 RepID=A0A9N7VDB8_PLEPL|nr:unnamed protein product [Pleuronectes platessa]